MTQKARNKEKRGADMSDVLLGKQTPIAAIGLFGSLSILVGWDLMMDYDSGSDWLHLIVESVLLIVAVVMFVWLVFRFLLLRSVTRDLERDLVAAQAEAKKWRAESRDLLDGLGVAIEKQFFRWKLTPAESEVGLLLLKGLSHKDVAQARGTSERTVRQQARSLYLKAGLAGRSELAAFFLEDLFLPAGGRVSLSV
jgi:DNA-binding CsgD family transcriptional regulator